MNEASTMMVDDEDDFDEMEVEGNVFEDGNRVADRSDQAAMDEAYKKWLEMQLRLFKQANKVGAMNETLKLSLIHI